MSSEILTAVTSISELPYRESNPPICFYHEHYERHDSENQVQKMLRFCERNYLDNAQNNIVNNCPVKVNGYELKGGNLCHREDITGVI